MRLVILGLSLALAGSAPHGLAAAHGPVTTQPLAAGEVLLEINALGSVNSRADYATLRAIVLGAAETETGARAATETKIREVRAALRALGVAAADIAVRPVTTSLNPPPSPEENPPLLDGMEANAIGLEANAIASIDEVTLPPPAAAGQAQMEIVIRNVDRVATVQQALAGHGIYTYGTPPAYALADAAGARRQARAQAMQKARADAEAYAASLNMRVVRIVRVTERIGLEGLGLIVSEADTVTRLFTAQIPSGPEVPTMVAVGVDFALAPR